MKTLPMPSFKSDDEAELFYETGVARSPDGSHTRDTLEEADRLLAKYGLQIATYNSSSSDCIFAIVPLD